MNTCKYANVMLIDDNDIDNFTNKKLIENANFASQVLVLNSAKAALEHLSSSTPENLPQLIFLDIMMPVMDGFEFLEQFEKLSETVRKNCKVIMLSTSESFKDLNRANKNIYVYKFLNKPLSDATLTAINV